MKMVIMYCVHVQHSPIYVSFLSGENTVYFNEIHSKSAETAGCEMSLCVCLSTTIKIQEFDYD